MESRPSREQGRQTLKYTAADLALAEIQTAENHLDIARQRLDNVLATEPRNVDALVLLAGVEYREGNRTGAISRYRSALAADGSNVTALNNLAYIVSVDDPTEALNLAQQAMELAPDNAAVEDTLGWVYHRKGVYRTAIEYLKKAVAKESTPRRQFHLGMSYLKAGDRELGTKLVQEAIRKDPKLPRTEQGW